MPLPRALLKPLVACGPIHKYWSRLVIPLKVFFFETRFAGDICFALVASLDLAAGKWIFFIRQKVLEKTVPDKIRTASFFASFKPRSGKIRA